MKIKIFYALFFLFISGCEIAVESRPTIIYGCVGKEEKVFKYTQICEKESVNYWHQCEGMAKKLYCERKVLNESKARKN
jgi:hypothetical protein